VSIEIGTLVKVREGLAPQHDDDDILGYGGRDGTVRVDCGPGIEMRYGIRLAGDETNTFFDEHELEVIA
jgi:hypothetical protein